ncbi:hypothetical protein C9374_012643 [Naegleria lovaniensis]|uniref:GCF C-terminal domain-containing protein n=1 Tax=Naegleria lovaniensis TaxID=51637 RepID=A0AA88KQE2_NAELO|nr:uncharacterized protein C9374_012643 [Naegleria lovaniensis]KAG2392391.1 hypothetical protein C9374_012643 [Naegleria lovaniensis]
MIKKRSAKSISSRNVRRGHEDDDMVQHTHDNDQGNHEPFVKQGMEEKVSEQDVIRQVLEESAEYKLGGAKSSSRKTTSVTNVLNLMEMYGEEDKSSSEGGIKFTVNKPPQSVERKYGEEDDDGISYKPKSMRVTKQQSTFSTSELRKRKRHTNILDVMEGEEKSGFEDNNEVTSNMGQIVAIKPEDTAVVLQPQDDHATNVNAGGGTVIPDDITIQAIKMKRKKLREASSTQMLESSEATSDYIPLDSSIPEKAGLGYKGQSAKEEPGYTRAIVTKHGDVVLHKIQQPTSRLVREDDEAEDAVDEIINKEEEVFETWKDAKIKFGAPNDDRNKGDVKESIGNIEIEDVDMIDEEDDEKMKEFSQYELNQMRNAGLSVPEHKQNIITQSNLFKPSEEIEKEQREKDIEKKKLMASILKFSSKKDDKRVIESFETVEKQLLERMKELEISHDKMQQVIIETNTEIEKSARMLSQLNEDGQQYEEQYTYFQEMNKFVDELADLLDTKLPEIEMLESQIFELQERYYQQLFEKSFHGHVTYMPSYRETQYERAVAFGGDGEAEMTNDRFLSEMNTLVEKMKQVFDDVNEEYISIPSLKKRFEGWKEKYPSLYRDTYCSLCLHNVFVILLRWELFTSGCLTEYKTSNNDTINLPAWSVSPLECTDFTKFTFWKELFNYGEVTMEAEPENLLPEVIRKSMISILLHTISKIYNPMDVEQSPKLMQLIKEYKIYLEGSNTKEESKISEAIQKRLSTTIHEFKFPSIATLNNELVTQAIHLVISILSKSVIPWIEWYPSLEHSDALKNQIVLQFINLKLMTFIDSCISHNIITRKEKIKFVTQLMSQCKLPNSWKRELNLSID